MAIADIQDLFQEARQAVERRSRRRHWQKWLEREGKQIKKDLADQAKREKALRNQVRNWISTARKLNEKEKRKECNESQGLRSCLGRLCRRR